MELKRASGILLHPTSLPGSGGVGSLGRGARRFLDALEAAGQHWWQILPLNPPGHGGSPYSASSAFAGNPVLIDLEELVDWGWLTRAEVMDFGTHCQKYPEDRFEIDDVTARKSLLIQSAYERWSAGTKSGPGVETFEAYCQKEAGWLDDYALYAALKGANDGRAWQDWDLNLVRREPGALADAQVRLATQVRQTKFAQWIFFDQWARLREDARERGIQLIGDIPIFVSMDSADAWANRALFELDDDGRAEAVAGVPPDYFSETGQRWGNPLYDWSEVARQGYAWWIERVRKVLETVDLVRIDHFRAFEDYWRIPADEPTAIKGEWIKGPGDAFFDAIKAAIGDVPFIAEDLGEITEEVIELRDRQGLPGMKVLQFAFGGEPDHPFLPHTYPRHAVAYTGTHDNDTSQGWYDKLDEAGRHRVRSYLHHDDQHIVWAMIEGLLSSKADLCIFPVQDLYELGTQARMNTPGVGEGNWNWRLTAQELEHPTPWQRLGDLTGQHKRRV